MTTTRPLEMLDIDLFGPITYISIGCNKYGVIIVDDYSYFTWVFFLQDKSVIQEVLKKSLKRHKISLMPRSRKLEATMAPSSRTLK
jgi:hypothetical protein